MSPAYTILENIVDISDSFYKAYFKSHHFVWHLSVAVVGIRDGKQISYDDFCTIKIPHPSFEEQTAIAHILDKSQQQISEAKNKLKKLKKLKKWFMQQLLTWKKRVPESYLTA